MPSIFVNQDFTLISNATYFLILVSRVTTFSDRGFSVLTEIVYQINYDFKY